MATGLVLALLLAAQPVRAIPQLLMDLRSGEVMFANEAGQPWHPASLTKLMTAFVAFEAIASGRVNLDTPVIISANAAKAPPSKVGLPVDTGLRLEDALYLMLVKSANDVSTAIAETISGSERQFIADMNLAAASLGMTGTRFANANGLHDPEQVTTARDLALLTLAILRRHGNFQPMFQTFSVRLGKARLDSNNDLLTGYAGTIGMKTGYVCAAGLNIVATAERGNRFLVAIILGGSSARERNEMAASLLDQGFSGRNNHMGQIGQIANIAAPPVDMRPKVCGREAAEYGDARKAEFPAGLEGQPSFLTASVPPREVSVTTLGRIRQVPLPRRRPAHTPVAPVVAAADVEPGPLIALPRPRPSR